MRNDPLSAYWYFTTWNRYPFHRNVVESFVRRRYKVFSLACEADKTAIKKLKLVYLGYGTYSEIQGPLMRAIKKAH